jgi:hypothetical protein
MQFLNSRHLLLAVVVALTLVAGWLITGSPGNREVHAGGDTDFNGVYEVLATPVPGNFFYCRSRVDHNLGTNAIDSTLVCYADTPATASSPYVSYLGRQDGVAGPVPPPPYGTGELPVLSGSYNPILDQINIAGCFNPVEGTIGPAVYTDATFLNASQGGSVTGTVDIYLAQNRANCEAGSPSGAPLAAPVTLTELTPGTDSDGDGCTNFQELDPVPGTRLGRDPYNPFDCDDLYSNIYDVTAIAQQQENCQGGQPAPRCTGQPDGIFGGLYFNCKGDVQVTNDGNTAVARPTDVRLFCYPDSTAINVNNHTAGSTGDGRGGAAPPGRPSGAVDFAEVHGSHAAASGTIPGGSDTLPVTICINNPHAQLGIVVARATIDFEPFPTGVADVFTNRVDCTPPAPGCTPGLTELCGVPLTLAEQGKAIDTDGDNCSDKEELSDSGAQGGLRDPFNVGDFMSVHTGPVSNLQKDQVVSVADISAVVARFGTNDGGGTATVNRNTNPKTQPTGTGYHPSYDRGGPIPNGAAAGAVARQLPAAFGSGAGSITVADISATVAQFGHSCAGAP